MSSKKVKVYSPSNESIVGMGSIDQVRDILFGSAQREHDERFEGIEQAIELNSKESAEALEEAQKALNKSIDGHAEDLERKLDRLAKRVDELEAKIFRNLEDSNADLNTRITKVDDSLREDLSKASKQANKELEALRDAVETALSKLGTDKAANADLAALFMNLAMQIKGETPLSSLEAALGKKLVVAGDD